MNKHLHEIKQHLEDIILKNDSGNLSVKQAKSLGKAMGVLEYLIERDTPVDVETFSNCCGVPMDRDYSFCPGCHEHAVVVDENDEEVK